MIYCQGIPIHLYQRRINHLVEHPVPLICMFWVLIHVVPAFSLFTGFNSFYERCIGIADVCVDQKSNINR